MFSIPMEPASCALIDYWHSIRGNDCVPSRMEFKPGDIPKLLPYICLLEYRNPGELIYRLVGSAIVDKTGTDYTGHNHLELVFSDKPENALERYQRLLTTPCGLYMRRGLRSRFEASFIAELVYLPLRDRHGKVRQIVGVASVVGEDDWGDCLLESAGQVLPTQAHDYKYIDLGAGVPDDATPRQVAEGRLDWLGDLDSNQGCSGQSREFYR